MYIKNRAEIKGAKMKNNNLYPNEYIPFTTKKEGALPPSENSFLINLCAFIIAVTCILLIKHYNLMQAGVSALLTFIAILTFSILSMEFLFRPQQSIFTKIKIRRKFNIIRWATKLLALFAIWSIIGFLYWLFPIYKDRLFTTYLICLREYWWLLCLLGAIYFALEDCIGEKSDDAYWQLGRWLMSFRSDAKKEEIVELLRGWGVKFFYLALMLPYFNRRLNWFMRADFSYMFDTPSNIFRYANDIIFFADLAIAAAGYMMTFKIFNTQIRSSEPTLFGWIVAVGCYWPFWSDLFSRYYLSYGTGIYWQNIFADSYWFYVWMFLILICEAIYSLATIALGIRFSNLTYRGLVTSGPYRFTKHPAYVFKNISWWLISMPFLAFGNNPSQAIRGTILLFALNLVYYARARTEESHLSHYPEYVEYALMMNKKSIFAPLAKLLPFLKYKEPEKK